MGEIIFTKAKPLSSDYCKMWVAQGSNYGYMIMESAADPYWFYVFDGEALPKPVTHRHRRTARECMAECRAIDQAYRGPT